MRAIACIGVFFILALPSALFAAGFSHDQNFIVYAPDQALSDTVIAKAEVYRKAEAIDLLGGELNAGKGRTIITVEVSATEDSGFTWPIDHPDRKFHEMWLTTSREKAAGSTLRHEIRHVVLNTRFPDRLPLWIEEGLASRSDDQQRQRLSRETALQFSRRGWPDIRSIVRSRAIHSTDLAAYSAATSLVNYLLTRGDTAKLLQFGESAKKSGCNQALEKCYGLGSLSELELKWHAWAAQENDSRQQARADETFQAARQ
jgi:hypothetical protein